MKWRGGRGKKRAEIRSQRALGIYEFMATIVIYLCRKTQRFSLSLSPASFRRATESKPFPFFLPSFSLIPRSIPFENHVSLHATSMLAKRASRFIERKVCLTFIAREGKCNLRQIGDLFDSEMTKRCVTR